MVCVGLTFEAMKAFHFHLLPFDFAQNVSYYKIVMVISV